MIPMRSARKREMIESVAVVSGPAQLVQRGLVSVWS